MQQNLATNHAASEELTRKSLADRFTTEEIDRSHQNRKWPVLHGLYMAFMYETGFKKSRI
jgi:hypothetical protein